VKVKSRPLTAGEVEMARLVFKDSIDYSAVRVHNEEYLPFGLQPNNTAMTPNGSMYFNPDNYVQDFSILTKDPGAQMWFIHEMVHVWQHQLGYSVFWKGFWISVTGGYLGKRAYKIDPTDSENSPDKHKIFSDFNLEQQAKIIEQYYGAKYLSVSLYDDYYFPFHERVLNDFLRRPKDVALLPK